MQSATSPTTIKEAVTDARLDWKPEKLFQKGSVHVTVTSAVGRSGRKLLSFSLGCATQDGKTSKHVKEIDTQTAIDLLLEYQQWQQAFRYEQDLERDARRR